LCKHRRQRRGIRDHPTCGKRSRASCLRTHRRVCVAKWTPSTPQGWCPGSLVAVGGLCQPARPGGVRPHETGGQQRVIRLDTARTGWFPPGDDSDEGSGTKATTTQTATQPPDPAPPPVAERPPEALLLIFGAHQTRPPAAHPNACAVTRTGAWSWPPQPPRRHDPRM